MEKWMAKYKQGLFRPTNPSKYAGNTQHIIYRSWLEFKAMSRLDNDPTIVKWASEEFYIPYISPIDKLVHRYFVDLFFEKRENTKTQKYICEVKPYDHTQPPKSKGRKLLRETATLATNIAKWQSANKWAKQHGCKFVIWTDRDL
jgi:hypothetical protein